MNQQAIPNITLFDLLARNWRRPAAVSQLCFNSDGTLLAIGSADGGVALARIADNEPPESRIAVEEGQTTIHPRQGKPSPVINTRVQEGSRIAACLEGNYLVCTRAGELLRITRSGEIAAKVLSDKSPITAFDHCGATGLTAAVVQAHLRLQSEAGGTISELALPDGTVEKIALSADGSMIALASADRLTIRPTAGDPQPVNEISLAARPLSLEWSADGKWLAAGLQTGGLWLIDIAGGRNVLLGDFPGPVQDLAWSAPTDALLASGAYRIAGWSMRTPPLANSATGALATGHPGFVMIDAVAAHPLKPLVAAGYTNGKVVVAGIGSPDELVIRDAGGPVTVLEWTPDGRHLAVGDAHGNAAIVTFPAEIFK